MAPGLTGELLNWDDDRFIAQNELIRSFSFDSLRQVFAEPHFEAYHPLHLVSYMIDGELWYRWAPGYKLHNLLLYLLCLGLLFRLLRELGLGATAAWIATGLFALHPLHVEAVVWATARKEPLSLAFMLGAALSYLRSERPADRAGLVTIALFALALLTKTSTVVLPALLLLLDLLVRRRPLRQSLAQLAPLVAVSLAIGLYVISLWQENEMARPWPERGALGLVALVGETYFHYLSKIVLPVDLSPVYPIDREGAFGLAAAAGYLLWALILVAALRWGDRLLALAAAWAAVALLPVSNLVPVYFFVQDRYALIATIGAAIAAGSLVEHALERGWRRPALALSGALAVALAVSAGLQARHWQTSVSLWQHATRAQPEAYYAFLALGHTLRDQGALPEAIDAYGRAVELEPELPFARISLCLADARRQARRLGRNDEEVDRVGSMLSRHWRSSPELLELAVRLLSRGYAGCAQLAESRAFDLAEPSPDTLVRAASHWTVTGHPELARRYLERAAQDRDEPDATALEVEAQALELLGQRRDARATLARSFELEPRTPEQTLEAAGLLLRRGRPELVLLYADQADSDAPEWSALRREAQRLLDEREEEGDTRHE